MKSFWILLCILVPLVLFADAKVQPYLGEDLTDQTIMPETERCDLQCPSNSVDEDEPRCCNNYVDNYNGGCSANCPVFRSIACGQTICGESGTFYRNGQRKRDTDWYSLVVTQEMDVVWSVIAEFRVDAAIVQPGIEGACDGRTVLASGTANTEQYLNLTARLLPGTYWFYVAPNSNSGVNCGADYIATLSCQNIPEPPVCQCMMQQADRYCDYEAHPLPDVTHVQFPVYVPVQYEITDVNVCLDLDHTYDSDLLIWIESPTGIQVVLSNHNGGSGDNYRCTAFDDQASTLISAGTVPFTGEFIPNEALAAFNGLNAEGVWTLHIEDGYLYDYGQLNWFCITFEYDDILPVELASFTATAGDAEVSLAWRTASEVNSDYFEIMRDGSVLTRIDARNDASGASYRYTDSGLENGHSYRYTLAAVDLNGARAELSTVNANPVSANANISEYALYANYPNPFNPTTNISFDLVQSGLVTLKIYNLVGQEVAALVNTTMAAGHHSLSFDATNLPSGAYLYRIETAGFSATRKMLLMK